MLEEPSIIKNRRSNHSNLSNNCKNKLRLDDAPLWHQKTIVNIPQGGKTVSSERFEEEADTEQPDFDSSQEEFTDSPLCSQAFSFKCKLPFFPLESNTHNEFCEIICLGIVLREKQASMLKSLTANSFFTGVVDKITRNICRNLILENHCDRENCQHTVAFDFSSEPNPQIALKIFTKWFIQYSKEPHLKVLLNLLSLLSIDFGDDLLILILTISQALFKLRSNLRRALGICIIEKLIQLLNLQRWEAIRIILIFTLTSETSSDMIDELLEILGVYENGMMKLYESVSCIWHITDSYRFQDHFLFKLVKDCVENMPRDIKFTRNKIIIEMLKIPKQYLLQEFGLIEKFCRFYPLNSHIAYFIKSFIVYKNIHSKQLYSSEHMGYKSCPVIPSGEINHKWRYWDLQESRRNAFALTTENICERQNDLCCETSLELSLRFPMGELVDDVAEATDELLNIFPEEMSNKTLPSNIFNNIRDMVYDCNYRGLSTTLSSCQHPPKKNLLDAYISALHSILVSCDEYTVPYTIFEVLRKLRRPGHYSSSFSPRTSFIKMANSLVVIFYERRDDKSALKILKAIRLCGENPFDHLPANVMNHATFAIICSDIHFKCRCFPEALRILFYSDTLDIIRFKIDRKLAANNCRLLDRLIFKMLEIFFKERLAGHLLDIFKAVLEAQKDLTWPINIIPFYEAVICNSFLTHVKHPAGRHDGANLYINVDKICGNHIRFHPTTYRGLIVELINARAPEDFIKRTLLLCLKFKIYPRFHLQSITLPSNLVMSEINLYIREFFSYCVAQGEERSLLKTPLSIRFISAPKPSGKFVIQKDVESVSNDISDALARLKSVLNKICGSLQDDLMVDSPSPGEAVISTNGVKELLRVLQLSEEDELN